MSQTPRGHGNGCSAHASERTRASCQALKAFCRIFENISFQCVYRHFYHHLVTTVLCKSRSLKDIKQHCLLLSYRPSVGRKRVSREAGGPGPDPWAGPSRHALGTGSSLVLGTGGRPPVGALRGRADAPATAPAPSTCARTRPCPAGSARADGGSQQGLAVGLTGWWAPRDADPREPEGPRLPCSRTKRCSLPPTRGQERARVLGSEDCPAAARLPSAPPNTQDTPAPGGATLPAPAPSQAHVFDTAQAAAHPSLSDTRASWAPSQPRPPSGRALETWAGEAHAQSTRTV